MMASRKNCWSRSRSLLKWGQEVGLEGMKSRFIGTQLFWNASGFEGCGLLLMVSITNGQYSSIFAGVLGGTNIVGLTMRGTGQKFG